MSINKSVLLKTAFSILSSAISVLLLNTFFERSSFAFSIEIGVLLFIILEVFLVYKDRFSPLLFLFISFGIGILDVILVGLNVRIVSNRYPMEVYEKTLGIIIIWIAFFIIGYFLLKKKNNNRQKKQAKHLKHIDNNIILIIFSLLYLFAVIKVAKTFVALGGVDSSIVNSAIFRYDNQAYLATILSLSSIIPICLMEKGKNKIALITTVLMLVVLVLTGRRGIIINYLLIPIITYINYKRIKISNKIGIVFLAISMTIILIIGNARGQSSASNSDNFVVESLTNLTVSTKLGESLPDTIYAIDSGKVDHSYFKYFFRGIIGLIPRAVWKEKPDLIDHSTIISSDIYNVTTYGRPIGSFGYSYYCFGIIGTIITGLVSGMLTKRFYHWMLNNKDYIHIFIYSVLVINMINIVKPESQLTIISTCIIIYIASATSYLFNKNNYSNLETV